jgi:16S rRNA (guanine527-N7)-methyltransferase
VAGGDVDHRDALTAALTEAQQLGFLGRRPIPEAIEHSMAFVRALPEQCERIVDIGSGGGLPGLVIAVERPEVELTLVDRREKRTDFLRRVVLRSGWAHVDVLTMDVAALADDVTAGRRPPFDAVTARGFGPPATTLRLAAQLVAPTGVVVISEPPAGDRWPNALLSELGVVLERRPGVVTFHVKRAD